MRRLVMVAGVLALVGCGGLRDMVSAHRDAVAAVGDRTLTAERMADLFVRSRALPMQADVMARVAHLWAGYVLFADRVLAGDSMLDSASVLAANWPSVQQILIGKFHDLVADSEVPLDSARVDSVYAAGELRLIRHILVRADSSLSATQRAAKRRQAERIHAQLAAGGSWDRANQANEDPNAKAQNGAIGVIGRGETVAAFDSAAFALAPGELGPVTETRFGFHVLRRPQLSEVRDAYRSGVRQRLVARLDSAYLVELPKQMHLAVRSSAPATVRDVARDPMGARQSRRVLASFDGGRVTAGDIARWLDVLPPRTEQQLQGARDQDITGFVTAIARNAMLVLRARNAGMHLDAQEYEQMRADLRQQLAEVRHALGLDSVAADSAGRGARAAVAARRVDAYLDTIATNPQKLVPMPTPLVDVMGEREPWHVYPAGVQRAFSLARDRRAALDSAAGRAGSAGRGRSP